MPDTPAAADRFTTCLTFTLAREGGWSDNPKDPGGATMRGVTLATFRAWRHDPYATVAELQRIAIPELTAIYAAGYWQPCRCQDLALGLDLMVMDHAVTSGPRRSAMLLQEAAGVNQVDGWIGPGTLAAVRTAGNLVGKLGAAQATFYRGLPTFATFGKGWLARVDARIAAATGTAPKGPLAKPVPVVSGAVSEADRLNDHELERHQ